MLNDLRERLARTRFPDQLENVGWSYGTDLSYLKELRAYWHSGFDWRAQERALDRFSHFHTEIDSLKIHFIHQRSKEKNAIPLIMTHGWPGSFFEFTRIIEPLTDPAAYGGRSEDAFHVICPSIPGYGFSEAPKKPGFGCKQVAEAFAKLMARLGYTQYKAQGGDWGAIISTWLAAIDTAHVKGLHLNTTLGNPPEETSTEAAEELSPEETEDLEKMNQADDMETGYAAIQGTKPQSLGYALNDSPAGLVALFACFPIFHLIIGIVFIALSARPNAKGNAPPAFVGWLFVEIASVAMIAGWSIAVCIITAGRFLAKRKHYMFCLVMAGIECAFMPFGTVLGVFTIIVLIRDSVKEMFSANQAAEATS